MARYHINKNDEVKPCRAKEGNCRFGGRSGSENHYADINAAKEEANKRLENKYSELKSTTKTLSSEQFKSIHDRLQNALVLYGGADKNELSKVKTVDEIVEKWFDGDSSRYRSFRRLMNDESMKEDAKRSVGGLIQKGMKVNSSSTVEGINSKLEKSKFVDSEVDLLDEPIKGMNIDTIKSGLLKAF